jgi:hypothetical protein
MILLNPLLEKPASWGFEFPRPTKLDCTSRKHFFAMASLTSRRNDINTGACCLHDPSDARQ